LFGRKEDDGRPDRPDWTDSSSRRNGSLFGRKEDDGQPDRPDWTDGSSSRNGSLFGRKEDDGRPDRPDAESTGCNSSSSDRNLFARKD
jgi:hypothetical protein